MGARGNAGEGCHLPCGVSMRHWPLARLCLLPPSPPLTLLCPPPSPFKFKKFVWCEISSALMAIRRDTAHPRGEVCLRFARCAQRSGPAPSSSPAWPPPPSSVSTSPLLPPSLPTLWVPGSAPSHVTTFTPPSPQKRHKCPCPNNFS